MVIVALDRWNKLMSYSYIVSFNDIILKSSVENFLRENYPEQDPEGIYELFYLRGRDLINLAELISAHGVFTEEGVPLPYKTACFGLTAPNTLPGLVLRELLWRFKRERDEQFEQEISAMVGGKHEAV